MKTTEKKSLFSAITEEESATVRGGNITISGTIDTSTFLAYASQYGVDLKSFQEQLALAASE